ncbi:zinc finger protein 27 isoform X2 [Cimex lectularius]|uniref:C2H2-type domain-containing protein n=1 Tax=Cimex lectularius TaxID=79782 RepID=A0A8I6SUS3_CIMLE|nr:zinc finger protein 27 isoform X2 [Cimex lectularius]
MSLTMANSIVTPEENYGFNLEWIAEGSGIGEEICGVDKDCIVVPSSPVLPKIEPDDPMQPQIDEYVEIQVTEEEVVTEQWQTQHNGGDVEGLNFRTGSEDDGIVPLPENQDEYSRLHPYPCDFCSRRFSKKAAMTVHMLSHQIERPHDCNMCGATYKRKFDLVEHMKIHAYAPPPREEEDYENLSTVPEAKAKLKKKKKRVKQTLHTMLTDKKQKKQTFSNNYDSALQEEMRLMVESVQPKFPVIDPARPYVCQHCGVGFAREKALLSHNMIHVGDSAYECDRCHDMFQTERQLSDHMSNKHGKYNTNTVSKKKSTNHAPPIENIQIKQETIDLTEEHMCQLCTIIFNTAEELACHKEDHDPDIGVHSCYLCTEVYESLVDLRDHIKLSHSTTHWCHQCDKVFKDHVTLSYHLVNHESKMTCPLCSRKFTSKLSFRRHITTHEDKQVLMCSECGSHFADGSSLLYHKQTDHGLNMARLFPCLECGKTFNSRSSQQIHIRIHTGEKPYGCRFCWKAFGDGGTLRKHERIHTGEKPYVCPVCSKAFNQRVVLREHVRAHHSGTESRLSENCYECIVCGQLFVNSGELCAHLVQHSDENTAKHRLPTTRKSSKKRKLNSTPGFEKLTGMNSTMMTTSTTTNFTQSLFSMEPDFAEVTNFFTPPTPKKKLASPVRHPKLHETSLDSVMKAGESAIESMNSILAKSSPKRARIVRSGKKGFHKGQNKRFQKGKSKTTRLLSNSSYASKYVVSQPDEFFVAEGESGNLGLDSSSDPLLTNGSDSMPRSRPRTKNVSYHNLKTEPRFELATFPVVEEQAPPVPSKPKKKKSSKSKSKKETLQNHRHSQFSKHRPQKQQKVQQNKVQHHLHPIDTQYVNGIDPSLFEDHHSGEPIETCIVDDIDVELKLEDRTTDSEIIIPKIEDMEIKTEIVSCDMCSEVFNSRSDLFKHIQIHI